jgi:hypothetical protein
MGNFDKRDDAMKSPRRVRQGDVTKALKAAKAAGLNVSRVDIEPDGKLSILIGDGESSEPASTPFDAWKQRQQNARPT